MGRQIFDQISDQVVTLGLFDNVEPSLAVAATPFAFAGITSAFWALLAGVAASLIVERREMLAHWRTKQLAVG